MASKDQTSTNQRLKEAHKIKRKEIDRCYVQRGENNHVLKEENEKLHKEIQEKDKLINEHDKSLNKLRADIKHDRKISSSNSEAMLKFSQMYADKEKENTYLKSSLEHLKDGVKAMLQEPGQQSIYVKGSGVVNIGEHARIQTTEDKELANDLVKLHKFMEELHVNDDENKRRIAVLTNKLQNMTRSTDMVQRKLSALVQEHTVLTKEVKHISNILSISDHQSKDSLTLYQEGIKEIRKASQEQNTLSELPEEIMYLIQSLIVKYGGDQTSLNRVLKQLCGDRQHTVLLSNANLEEEFFRCLEIWVNASDTHTAAVLNEILTKIDQDIIQDAVIAAYSTEKREETMASQTDFSNFRTRWEDYRELVFVILHRMEEKLVKISDN